MSPWTCHVTTNAVLKGLADDLMLKVDKILIGGYIASWWVHGQVHACMITVQSCSTAEGYIPIAN